MSTRPGPAEWSGDEHDLPFPPGTPQHDAGLADQPE